MTSEAKFADATIQACADKLVDGGLRDRAAAFRGMIYIALAALEDEHKDAEDHDALRRDMAGFAATVADTLQRWGKAA
jgi:hypothetical protein